MQPFINNNIYLICNGEIYNHDTIRREHFFISKSNSDCEVIIHLYQLYGIEKTCQLLDGVFYSSIICEREKIEQIIDARTSDAIALALRFNAPIFTYKNILDKAGIHTETGTKKTTTSKKTEIVSEQILIGEERKEDLSENDFSKHSLKTLKKLLTEAVNNEEYEKAVNIRDEISKRK